MLSDALAAGAPALSPRAGIAMLTLQLRAVQQAANDAEAAEVQADEDAARQELRDRLMPLLDDRRAALELALTEAREEAAAEIAAARRAGEVMLARAQSPAAVRPPVVAPPVVAPPVVAPPVVVPPVVATMPAIEPTPPPTLSSWETLSSVDAPAPLIVAATEPLAVAATPSPSSFAAASPANAAPVSIGIDAEAFARVFAAVFASMLDERLLGGGIGPSHQLPALAAPAPAAKKGFWASALHVDVLLLGAAMVIMLVVLAAWLA